MRFTSLKETIRWWLAPGPHRLLRAALALALLSWAAWELVLAISRWLQLTGGSAIWWLLFFAAIPLLSLCSIPPLASLILIPTIFTGQGNRTAVVLTLLSCGILVAALAAVLPVIQFYVRLSLMVWF
ncbi:MAG: hypothetical protein R6U70_05765 [Bacillota bacterium]